jgi:hypothetical protein
MVSDDNRNAFPIPLKNPAPSFSLFFFLSQSQNRRETKSRMVVKNNTGFRRELEKMSFKRADHAWMPFGFTVATPKALK